MPRQHPTDPNELVQFNVRVPATTVDRFNRLRTLGAGNPPTRGAFFSQLVDEAWQSQQPALANTVWDELSSRRDALVTEARDRLQMMHDLAKIFPDEPLYGPESQQEVLEMIGRLQASPIPPLSPRVVQREIPEVL